MINKNLVIFVLAVFIVIGSIWGSIANKKKLQFQDQLVSMNKELKQTNQFRDEMLAKIAGLQADLEERESQLVQAREELTMLRKTNKGLEAKLSIRTAAINKISQEKKDLAARLKELSGSEEKLDSSTEGQQKDDGLAACEANLDIANKKNIKLKEWLEKIRKEDKAATNEDVQPSVPKSVLEDTDRKNTFENELQEAKNSVEELKQQLSSEHSSSKRERDLLALELDSAKAQVIGLEKIVEEKNETIEKTEKDAERLRLNMEVLLTTISNQKDRLEKLQTDNKELVKTLTVKNENISDLQEKLLRSPVN